MTIRIGPWVISILRAPKGGLGAHLLEGNRGIVGKICINALSSQKIIL